jgi:LPXTG-motif cell wall-anchored protein
VLIAALGGVLITTGISSTAALNVGSSVTNCGGLAVGGQSPCPTGTITFNETDKVIEGVAPTETPGARPAAQAAKARAAAEPTSPPSAPAHWEVTVTSDNCAFPNTSSSSMVLQVPDGGSKASDALYIATDSTQNTLCNYSYVETAVANWSVSYSPNAPQSLDPNQSNPNIAVAMVNTAYYLPATAPTKSSGPTHSANPTHKATVRATVKSTRRATPTAVLPNTGGSHIGITAWIGALLVLVGIWLVVAPSIGRRRRSGRHS